MQKNEKEIESLKKVPTKYLVLELMTRAGVGAKYIKPSENFIMMPDKEELIIFIDRGVCGAKNEQLKNE